MRETTERFISLVESNYNPAQPWLAPPKSYARSGWGATNLMRRSQDGKGVRSPGIESATGDCLRNVLHSMWGVSAWKMDANETVYKSKGGVLFNAEIDNIVRNNGFVVGNDPQHNGAKYWEKKGAVYLSAPRSWQNVVGKSKKSFFGCFDYSVMNRSGQMEIIELKAVPVGEEIPVKPLERNLRQLAAYVVETNSRGGGALVYLPSNLDTLLLPDESTYAVFEISWEEALDIYASVQETLNKATEMLNWNRLGNQSATYVYSSPKWFYGLMRNIPPCDNPLCCAKHFAFMEGKTIFEDWTYAETQ